MTTGQRVARWWITGGWYFVIAIVSVGFLSPVPFAHAAIRTRRRTLWSWTALYVAAVVLIFVFAAVAPHNAAGTPTGPLTGFQVALTMLVWVAAPLHLMSVRREVFGLRRPTPPRPGVYHDDPAVAAGLARRERRADARRLAAADPRLARELAIGRPDLRMDYDDGGLADLNTAPEPVLLNVLGLDAEQVRQITDLRGPRGVQLTDVEDLFAFTDLPYPLWDRIREHGIVLGQ